MLKQMQEEARQKAQLFTSRSSAVYSGLKSYQYNINSQISDDIDQVNELGKTKIILVESCRIFPVRIVYDAVRCV